MYNEKGMGKVNEKPGDIETLPAYFLSFFLTLLFLITENSPCQMKNSLPKSASLLQKLALQVTQ